MGSGAGITTGGSGDGGVATRPTNVTYYAIVIIADESPRATRTPLAMPLRVHAHMRMSVHVRVRARWRACASRHCIIL